MSGTTSVVLLIEPTDQSRTVYADALRGSGYIVVGVPDCTAALSALAELTPHIIIVGFDPRTHDECLAFCARLKADPRTVAIPTLLMSETIDGEDLHRATDMKVLGVTVGQRDAAKITGAVRGVLAVADAPRRRVEARTTDQ
jgi:CheY-like chemotaxis protein